MKVDKEVWLCQQCGTEVITDDEGAYCPNCLEYVDIKSILE